MGTGESMTFLRGSHFGCSEKRTGMTSLCTSNLKPHRVSCVVRGYTVGRQSEVGYPGSTGSVALCGGTLWADSQRLGTQGPRAPLRCAGVHCGQTVRGWVPRVHRVSCVVRRYTLGRQSEVGYQGSTDSKSRILHP
jgi:hypothetical protein